MKTAKIVLVIVFAAAIISGAKLGYSYFLPRVIPLCSGYKPGIYDLAGIVMIILFLYALCKRRRKKDQPPDNHYYNQMHRQDRTDSYGQNRNYKNRYR